MKGVKRNTKIRSLILKRIEESPKMSVFFLTDFSDLGSLETVRKVLGDAVNKGILRHLAHGIYSKTYISRFGEITPAMEDIAKKIAERDHVQIQPAGITAANIIGLSTQVPMVLSYLTTGSTRIVNIGKESIIFQHAAPRYFAFKGNTIPLVVQALKDFGPDNITDVEISDLYRCLESVNDQDTLQADMLLAPKWIQTILKPIINNIIRNENLATLQHRG